MLHAMQVRGALQEFRQEMKTCMDPDRELAVLREAVVALQEAKRSADAFQAKYHKQLAECEQLQADVKRAQVLVLKFLYINMLLPRLPC